MADPTAAQEDCDNLLRIRRPWIVYDRPKPALCELIHGNRGARVLQLALWRKYDERFSQPLQHLPTQAVKDLGRVRQIENLKIVLGRQLEKSLDSRARMLGPGAFKTVREQQDEAGQLSPLVLGCGDKLIDDHLSGIGEITELCFPNH